MTRPILRPDALEWTDYDQGPSHAGRRAKVGARVGARKLGCSVYELAPGQRALPFHAHLANEELDFVLEGRGTPRLGDAEHPVRGGDFIGSPPGDASAHQLLNDSDAPLRFAAVSTMEEPDVIRYPDSGRLGVLAGSAPGGRSEERTVTAFFFQEDAVGYLDGEPGGRG